MFTATISLGLLTNHPLQMIFFSQPFVEKGNSIFKYFLPKEYAIAIPATVLVVGLVVVGMFIGVTLSRLSNNRKKK